MKKGEVLCYISSLLSTPIMKSTSCKSNSKAIMLVDDSEVDNFIHQKVMENAKFSKCTFIHTGTISALEFLKDIEKLEEPPKGLIPDFIFLDINMPMLDGFHFLEEFEKLSIKLKSSIKVVMLTASINENDIERTKGYSSVVKFLNKPLSEADLQVLCN